MSAYGQPQHDHEPAGIHDVLSRLHVAPAAPDLSQSIMNRLGYRRVSARMMRRRQLAAWANRAGIAMVAAVALAIGWRVLEASEQIRRPAGTTVPEAIQHDLQLQQERLDGAIRGIRSISTPRLSPAPRVGPTPLRDNSPQPPLLKQELQDDVNRSSIAPVRWV